MTPQETLDVGAVELATVLEPAGFTFVRAGGGSSSGGIFASGEFRRGDRRLELHVRYSLGLVRYHVGLESLSHEDLVRAVRAVAGIDVEPQYPGFAEDPSVGFRHLLTDLARFGSAFVSGTDEDFRDLVKWIAAHPKKVGFAALS